MNKMNKITAEETNDGIQVVCKGGLGFIIVTARELLNVIAQSGPNVVTEFTAALSTIIETNFEDPEDRKRIATLLYREFGGYGKCMKF